MASIENFVANVNENEMSHPNIHLFYHVYNTLFYFILFFRGGREKANLDILNH